MMLEEQGRSERETFRELKRFYAQADYLKTQLEEKYGKLTDETKEKLDVDMWMYRIKEMMAIDFVYNGRLLNTTLEFLIALPEKNKKEMLHLMKDEGPNWFVEWYENKDEDITPQIPVDLPSPTKDDLMQLFSDTQILLEDIRE